MLSGEGGRICQKSLAVPELGGVWGMRMPAQAATLPRISLKKTLPH